MKKINTYKRNEGNIEIIESCEEGEEKKLNEKL